MKRIIYSTLLASVLGFYAQAQDVLPKLSPLTKAYLKEAKSSNLNQPLPSGYLYKKRADGKTCISAVIKVSYTQQEKVEKALTLLDAKIGTKAGSIWTVVVPANEAVSFCNIKGIDYIEMDHPVFPNLETAKRTTRVDSVHAGYGLPKGYTGKDVILGVIDFGFDYNHPTLYDTNGHKYRIVKAWEMGTTGTPPSGYSYGHELSDSVALKTQGTDNAEQTHGTGVAGLSSGSGYGGSTPEKYRGIAYESEMVFVGVRRDSLGSQWLSGGFSDFIDGVAYLMNYAKSVGKPIVVNISWGSHSGPHDGSSLVNQAFDTLSGPGRIIVMSAGNDGGSNIHLSKTFSAADTAVNTFLSFTVTPLKRTWIDIWGDTAKTFCVNTTLYNSGTAGNSTGKICIDNTTKSHMLISADGNDTCFVETMTSSAEYNMKPRVTINIYNKTNDNVGISVLGTDGSIHMWNEYYYYGYQYKYASYFVNLGQPWATNGNNQTTVSDMGAAKSTVLVGAYNSKVLYDDINGNLRNLGGTAGQYSSFTSRGPYVDGRISPDISAPGRTIATAANSWDTQYSETGALSSNTVEKFFDSKTSKNYYFSEFQGTSASAPIASGIIALMLQINPNLNPTQVKDILSETAIKDFFTGALPVEGSNIWGKGKINAYGAIRKVVKDLSIAQYSGQERLDCVLFPNPNQGNFTLDYQSLLNETVWVNVLDLNGRQLKTEAWKVNKGNNTLAIDLSQMPKGNYVVQVKSARGSVGLKTTIQ